MFIFDDSSSWRCLDSDEIRRLVDLLNQHLQAPGEPGDFRPLAAGRAQASQGEPDTALHVVKAWSTPLRFYPAGWHLCRLECAVDSVPSLAGYEPRAYLFAVCGPQEEDCTVLDWSSYPIHQLNEKLQLDLSIHDDATIRQYLQFFCNFLAGEPEGAGMLPPFVLPLDVGWFRWEEAIDDLESVAAGSGLMRLELPLGVDAPDQPDFPEPPASAKPPVQVLPLPRKADGARSNVVKKQAVDRAFDDHAGTPLPQPRPAPAGPREEAGTGDTAKDESKDVAAEFVALVWFRDVLFRGKFQVARRGEVRMASDETIVGALPVPRWVVCIVPGGIRLLCRQLRREVLSAAELLERVRLCNEQDHEPDAAVPGAGGSTGVPRLASWIRSRIGTPPGPAAGPAVPAAPGAAPARVRPRLRGLRVRDPLRSSQVFKGAMVLEDVEFVHDVVLDDAVFERSLELVNCRFLRRLSAHATTVKGALRLEGSRIDGAVPLPAMHPGDGDLGDQQQLPSLDLRGLKVERTFIADRLVCFGPVKGQWCRITGTLRARGLQIYLRGEEIDGDTAIDLSHAQIDGPLDLRGHVARQREPGGGRQRCVLGGSAALAGLRAAEIDLSGAWVDGHLDLDNSQVSGQVLLMLCDPGFPDGQAWRGRVAHSLMLNRARTGVVSLDGSDVGQGLSMVEMQLSGSLMAQMSGRFRTRLGGDLLGSGAQVSGGIELVGTRIDGAVEFVGGRFGRLFADPDFWVEQGGKLPHACATEVRVISLSDVAVDSSLYLAGLRVTGKDEEALFTQGLRLGGGVRFWSLTAERRLSERIKGVAPQASKAVVQALVAELGAELDGRIDLRGMRAEGSISLGRLNAAGRVLLDNARIGGGLFAQLPGEEAACKVEAFSADTVRVAGHADLRGLFVRKGDLRMRDAEVGGQLRLATAPEDQPASGESDAHAEVHKGTVDLQGTRAARLVLSSSNVGRADGGGTQEGASAPAGRVPFVLTRCQVGQLRILGFEGSGQHKRFPHPISLATTSVGDWGLDPETEALPLLKATEPFDGRNYIDMEQRLGRIGKHGVANKAYRKMLWRGKSWFWARLGNRVNWLLTLNGTHPEAMVVWLLVTLLPLVLILSHPANVEFTTGAPASSAVGDDRKKDAAPGSDGVEYRLEDDWNTLKATGLAASYGVPFLSGSRFDVVRARLVGPTCMPELKILQFFNLNPGRPPDPQACGGNPRPRSCSCKALLTAKRSPHELAMMISTFQFLLWILLAANLPTIARRRS